MAAGPATGSSQYHLYDRTLKLLCHSGAVYLVLQPVLWPQEADNTSLNHRSCNWPSIRSWDSDDLAAACSAVPSPQAHIGDRCYWQLGNEIGKSHRVPFGWEKLTHYPIQHLRNIIAQHKAMTSPLFYFGIRERISYKITQND